VISSGYVDAGEEKEQSSKEKRPPNHHQPRNQGTEDHIYNSPRAYIFELDLLRLIPYCSYPVNFRNIPIEYNRIIPTNRLEVLRHRNSSMMYMN
jgi:hypothetical protein